MSAGRGLESWQLGLISFGPAVHHSDNSGENVTVELNIKTVEKKNSEINIVVVTCSDHI